MVSRVLFRNAKGRGFAMLVAGCLYSACLHAADPSDPASSANTEARAWLGIPLSLSDARHLLHRTGFGASLVELKAFAGLSRGEAVDRIINGLSTESAIGMPAWVNAPAPHFWARSDMQQNERRRFRSERDQEMSQLRQWWVSNMLQTDSPQTERLVLFWHDHFATSYFGINRQSTSMARQNQTFRQLGTGSFRTLLKAMIRDPALLNYLDAQSNSKKSPNENLARELLELFTLGEGHYDETSVKEAARALTGHAIAPAHNMAFRLRSSVQDRQTKTLFGITGEHDGDALIDIILEQPAAAQLIARRFWHAFIADAAADPEVLDVFADTLRQSDYSITALYRAILESKSFWSGQYRGSLVKSPADLLIGVARTLEYPKLRWQEIPSMLDQLGMHLFAPPDVGGWTEGAAFVTTGRLLDRYRAIDQLLKSMNTRYSADRLDVDKSMAMQSGSMNIQANSMAMQSSKLKAVEQDDSGTFHVRLAAENFQGPAGFRVDLTNAENVLWSSGPQEIVGGHDTERIGRIADVGSLAWQTVSLRADPELLIQATGVAVHFINDAAGGSGDRNLYVDGVHIGQQWLASADGSQQSECPPENALDAGNLYCNGVVIMEIPAEPGNDKPAAVPAYQASHARLRWAKYDELENRFELLVSLENLKTPSRHYDTFSFRIVMKPGTGFELRIEAYECWPACITDWPDCAWQHAHDAAAMTLSLPLVAEQDDKRWCHYNSIAQDERQLIRVLWNSVVDLLGKMRSSPRGERFAAELAVWDRLALKFRSQLEVSRYAHSDERIQIESAARVEPQRHRMLSTPLPRQVTLDALVEALGAEGLMLADLLLPGVQLSAFPELQSSAAQLPAVQLKKLIEHPAFQVH